jgi:hypothetical protein
MEEGTIKETKNHGSSQEGDPRSHNSRVYASKLIALISLKQSVRRKEKKPRFLEDSETLVKAF